VVKSVTIQMYIISPNHKINMNKIKLLSLLATLYFTRNCSVKSVCKNVIKFKLLMFFIICTNPVIANDSYKGLVVPPYPELHIDKGGYLIGFNIKSKKPIFAISHTIKDKSQYFWLKKEIGRKNNNKNPIWKVLDVIVLDEPKINYFYALGLCRLKQDIDDRIIALVKYEKNKEWFTEIKKSWLVNIKKEKIEKFKAMGISCANEGWGL